ncbi:MAG: hypothetical protein OXN89_13530 [Bryobacterales bacterium]|nr:hypothetical protein [Bryobacterales bacterium]
MDDEQAEAMRVAILEEVDRMTEDELMGFKEFLATYPDRASAAARRDAAAASPRTEEER